MLRANEFLHKIYNSFCIRIYYSCEWNLFHPVWPDVFRRECYWAPKAMQPYNPNLPSVKNPCKSWIILSIWAYDRGGRWNGTFFQKKILSFFERVRKIEFFILDSQKCAVRNRSSKTQKMCWKNHFFHRFLALRVPYTISQSPQECDAQGKSAMLRVLMVQFLTAECYGITESARPTYGHPASILFAGQFLSNNNFCACTCNKRAKPWHCGALLHIYAILIVNLRLRRMQQEPLLQPLPCSLQTVNSDDFLQLQ